MNQLITNDTNVDKICAADNFEELISKLSSKDNPAIRSALDTMSQRTELHTQKVQLCLLRGSVATILHTLSISDSLAIKTSALLALYIHIQKYNENQAEVNRQGGIETLVELLSLQYCDILHQVLIVVQICLANNEQNQTTFSQVGGFQVLFELIKQVDKDLIQKRLSYNNITNHIVDVIVLCAELQENITIFWSEPTYVITCITLYLSGIVYITKALLQFIQNDDETKEIIKTNSGENLVVSLLASKNYCLAKASFSALQNWLHTFENHKKFLASTAMTILVENICCSNKFAQLSSARIIADCAFIFDDFKRYVSQNGSNLISNIISILAEDQSQVETVAHLKVLLKLPTIPLTNGHQISCEKSVMEVEEILQVQNKEESQNALKEHTKTETLKLEHADAEVVDLTASSPISTLDAPATPDYSDIVKCDICGGFQTKHKENHDELKDKWCECPLPHSNSASNNYVANPRLQIRNLSIEKFIKDEAGSPIHIEPDIFHETKGVNTRASVAGKRKRGKFSTPTVLPTEPRPYLNRGKNKLPRANTTTSSSCSSSTTSSSTSRFFCLDGPTSDQNSSQNSTFSSPTPPLSPVSSYTLPSSPFGSFSGGSENASSKEAEIIKNIESQLQHFKVAKNPFVASKLTVFKSQFTKLKNAIFEHPTQEDSSTPSKKQKRAFGESDSDSNDKDSDYDAHHPIGARGKKPKRQYSKKTARNGDKPKKKTKKRNTSPNKRFKPQPLPPLPINASEEWNREMAEQFETSSQTSTTTTSSTFSSPPISLSKLDPVPSAAPQVKIEGQIDDILFSSSTSCLSGITEYPSPPTTSLPTRPSSPCQPQEISPQQQAHTKQETHEKQEAQKTQEKQEAQETQQTISNITTETNFANFERKLYAREACVKNRVQPIALGGFVRERVNAITRAKVLCADPTAHEREKPAQEKFKSTHFEGLTYAQQVAHEKREEDVIRTGAIHDIHTSAQSSFKSTQRAITYSASVQNIRTADDTNVYADNLRRLEKRMNELTIKNALEWSVGDVCDWLIYIGLGNHVRYFQQLRVNGFVLIGISEEKIVDSYLRIRYKSERKVFMEELAKLKKMFPTAAPTRGRGELGRGELGRGELGRGEVGREIEDDGESTEPELDEVLGFGIVSSETAFKSKSGLYLPR